MDREAILAENAAAHLHQEAESRRFLYQDVEELLEVGFLTQSIRIEDSVVTVRSLLPPDTLRLRARVASLTQDTDILRWSLASSVWMVNGFELPLDPSENGPYYIHQEWVQNLPKSAIIALTSVTAGLNNRIRRAIKITEAYCYEDYSRSMWRMHGRPASSKKSNVIHRLWGAYNMSEDSDQADEKAWSHTRAVVGSMSNKGAKHITKELEKLDKRESQRRQRVIEDAVNWIIQGDVKADPLTIMVEGRELEVSQIHSPRTTEELEAEMRRVFSGDEDWHDHLVNQYHKDVRARILKRREERQQLILDARRRSEAAEEEGRPAIVGYTKEQLDQLQPGVITPKTTATLPASAQSNHVFDRYFSPTLKPGVLTPNLQVTAPDARDQKSFSSTKSSEEPSEPTLQEKIANRKPQLGEP